MFQAFSKIMANMIDYVGAVPADLRDLNTPEFWADELSMNLPEYDGLSEQMQGWKKEHCQSEAARRIDDLEKAQKEALSIFTA